MSTQVTNGDWRYTRDLRNSDSAPGGLVLQDVYHQQYLLAKDIRVTRVWVGSHIAGKVILKNYKLGSSELPIKTSHDPINLPSEQGLIKPFRTPLKDLVSYETVGPALGPNTDSEKIVIQQNYLFSDYGKDPPHEPGGLINAARIYPLVSFSYPSASAEAHQLDYIRVDYRLALTVEQFLGDTTNVKRGTEFQDQIGVFKDSEKLGYVPTIKDIFEAIEKPVKWELLAEGVDWGKKGQWDNIHQWAAGKLPETPGASHAAHLHWRWGTPATEQTKLPPKPKAGPQFAGPAGAGAPLLDPRIPEQRLRFAITSFTSSSDGPKTWAADENGSTANFEELFIKARSTPLDISKGTGLVIWLSVEARRKPTNAPWQGTFFAHGMFFAHELASLGRIAKIIANVDKSLYQGTVDTPTWWRPKRPDDL